MAKSMTKKITKQTLGGKSLKNVKERDEENVFFEDIGLERLVNPCVGQPPPPPPPPDGGWGWFVVFGSFMIHVLISGVMYSFGLFYVEFLYYFHKGKGATAWISSIFMGIAYCGGPISSILVNKYGCRAVVIGGSILSSLSLLASVWAPSVIVLYFTIGLGTGLGFNLVYLPAIVCVSRYFEKYRSLATSIAACGAGFGTLVFAPFIEYLIDSFGWRGALMITSGVILNIIICGAMFRPLESVKWVVAVPMKDLSKNPKQIENTRQFTVSTIKKGTGRQDSPSNVDNAKEHFPKVQDDDTNVMEGAPSQPILTTKGIVNHDPGCMEKSSDSNRKNAFDRDTVDNIRRRSDTNMTRRRASLTSLLTGTSHYKQNETLECLPNSAGTEGIFQSMLELSLLKDPVFLLFTFSSFCTHIGYDVTYVYLVVQAEERGIQKDVSSILLSVIGIANIAGRVIVGYVSDKPWINRLLVYKLCLSVCGLSTVLSAFCDSFATFALYGIIFGFTTGGYIALTSVILVDLLGLENLTNAFGLLQLFQGFANFLGPPIAGWLYDALNSYDPGFFMAGGMIGTSGLMLFFIPTIQRRVRKKADRENRLMRIEVMS